jgi:hypothetical protein
MTARIQNRPRELEKRMIHLIGEVYPSDRDRASEGET